jgi:hypothetical protein
MARRFGMMLGSCTDKPSDQTADDEELHGKKPSFIEADYILRPLFPCSVLPLRAVQPIREITARDAGSVVQVLEVQTRARLLRSSGEPMGINNAIAQCIR